MSKVVGGGGVGCFFFNDTATTEIYTLSLHDALPICVFIAVALCAASGLVEPKEIYNVRKPTVA